MVSTISQDQAHYDKLRTVDDVPVRLYVQGTQNKTVEQALGLLGSGGSKRVFQLKQGKALLLPRTLSFEAATTSKKWPTLVDDEITASFRVKALGILCSELEKVDVFMSPDSTDKILGCRTDTFEHLKEARGIWIIDSKTSLSSTWSGTFFAPGVDRYDEKNWELVIRPFLRDVAKLILNNFRLDGDCTNYAVVKTTGQTNPINCYEIHFFGFDFSSNHSRLSFDILTNVEVATIVKHIAADFFGDILHYEFGNEHSEQRNQLQDRLEKKFTDALFKEFSDPRSLQ